MFQIRGLCKQIIYIIVFVIKLIKFKIKIPVYIRSTLVPEMAQDCYLTAKGDGKELSSILQGEDNEKSSLVKHGQQ